jgi:hypothetical protein
MDLLRAAAPRASRPLLWAGLGFAACVLAGAYVLWDGAYYMFTVLDQQAPLAFHGRHAGQLPQLPVILASHLTSDPRLLRVVFGASYAAIPLLGLALSWWICRRRAPGLMLWPLLGTCLVLLPGRLFGVGESLMVVDLGWPLYLATVLGLPRWPALASLALGAVIFTLHPAAALVYALVALLAAGAAAVRPGQRPLLAGWGALFAGAAAVRWLIPRDPYEQAGLTAHAFRLQYDLSVAGRPLAAIVAAGVVGVAALGVRLRRGGGRSLPPWAATAVLLLPLLVAAAVILPWARHPADWAQEVAYREFAVLLSLPFVALLGIDALGPARLLAPTDGSPGRARAWAAEAVAVLFAAVLAVQAITTHSLLGDLRAQLAASRPCLAPTAVVRPGTAIDFWSVGALAIVLQGRDPATVVLSPADCDRLRSQGVLRLTFFQDLSARGGWYRLPSGAALAAR